MTIDIQNLKTKEIKQALKVRYLSSNFHYYNLPEDSSIANFTYHPKFFEVISKGLKNKDTYFAKVAKLDNKIIGMVLGRIRLDKGYISHLYVLPQFYSQGVGSRLLDTAEKWFQAKDIIEVQLEVLSRNRKAIEFYKKHNYFLIEKKARTTILRKNGSELVKEKVDLYQKNLVTKALIIYNNKSINKATLYSYLSNNQINTKKILLAELCIIINSKAAKKNQIILGGNKINESEIDIYYFKRWRNNLLGHQFASAIANSINNKKSVIIDSEITKGVFTGKLNQLIQLNKAGLCVPKTLAFISTENNKDIILSLVESNFKFPVVIKPNSGSFGINISLAKSKDELRKIIDEQSTNKILLIQEYIPHKYTYRIFTFNNKCLYVQKRFVDENNFKVTGSSQENFKLNNRIDPKYVNVALKAAKVLRREIAGIDIILRNNNYYILEVNPSPGMTADLERNKKFRDKFTKEFYNLANKISD